MDCSTPGYPVLHRLPELAQTHVHEVDDVIQPSHPLLPPSLPSLNLSQQQGLFHGDLKNTRRRETECVMGRDWMMSPPTPPAPTSVDSAPHPGDGQQALVL